MTPQDEPPRRSSLPDDLLRANPETYGDHYCQHRFDQYKLAVDMADRVSARRMQANTFFLAVNTGLLTLFANLVKERILTGPFGVFPIVALLLLCVVWWQIVDSYRQLNADKFKVILAMEALLPLAPYNAEQTAAGQGEEDKRYRPLTRVESWVPGLFGLLYGLLLVAMALVGPAPGGGG